MILLTILAAAGLILTCWSVYKHQRLRNQRKETTRNYRDMNGQTWHDIFN